MRCVHTSVKPRIIRLSAGISYHFNVSFLSEIVQQVGIYRKSLLAVAISSVDYLVRRPSSARIAIPTGKTAAAIGGHISCGRNVRKPAVFQDIERVVGDLTAITYSKALEVVIIFVHITPSARLDKRVDFKRSRHPSCRTVDALLAWECDSRACCNKRVVKEYDTLSLLAGIIRYQRNLFPKHACFLCLFIRRNTSARFRS